jgi:hypothetical protein
MEYWRNGMNNGALRHLVFLDLNSALFSYALSSNSAALPSSSPTGCPVAVTFYE